MASQHHTPAGTRWAKFWDCLRRAFGALCV